MIATPPKIIKTDIDFKIIFINRYYKSIQQKIIKKIINNNAKINPVLLIMSLIIKKKQKIQKKHTVLATFNKRNPCNSNEKMLQF